MNSIRERQIGEIAEQYNKGYISLAEAASKAQVSIDKIMELCKKEVSLPKNLEREREEREREERAKTEEQFKIRESLLKNSSMERERIAKLIKFIKRKYKFYKLPGGKLDTHDSCVKIEVLEEILDKWEELQK